MPSQAKLEYPECKYDTRSSMIIYKNGLWSNKMAMHYPDIKAKINV